MKIFVKLPDGREKPIQVKGSTTLKEVKGHVQDICQIELSEQQLVFCDKVLEDYLTLDDCGVIKESILHVVACMRSGSDKAHEKLEPREVILPGCAISLNTLEEYLRSHVDSCARVEQSTDPDVVGIVVVNTDELLTGDQLRDILSSSKLVSEQELEAWVAEYCAQQQQRSAESTGCDSKNDQPSQPWIDLLDCRQSQQSRSQTHETTDYDINPKEYSDDGLQDFWMKNKTAVDCEVRLSRGSPSHKTIARIDSMSGGCFISRRVLDVLQAIPDEDRTCSFQCPNGILETEGTVWLLVYWKDSHQQANCAKVKFNVPSEWELAVDMLVTVPMAEALGIDKVARGVTRDNILAANERIFGRILFRSQDKKARIEAEKVNAIKAQQNLKAEAEWLQRHKMLRHSSQPYPAKQPQISAK